MSLGKVPDWVALQTKVFTRWINQKFMSAGRPERIDNVLTGFGDGVVFGAFLEALSEQPCNAKWNKNAKLRVSHVDNINMALDFAKNLGVQVKNFPQATDFLDGQERPVLGFVWACILKFLKFGDDDEADQLNAKDALLMWVQNKTTGYKGVNIEKFPNSFKDGLALCALIHSCRPQLVNYEALTAGDGAIEASFDAAEKYFELEKYVTVDEFKRFDEVSMVVYVSDYYYGIARERKKDRAARRIGKVIKFTKEMDARKVEFNERALKFRAHVKEVEKVLGDRTIDNNMAGAVKRLDDFDNYKREDKNVLIGDQLNLESQYNGISTRLSDKSRPKFQPPPGCGLTDVEKTMKELEEAEAERNVALHAELNRQRRLLKMDGQHKERNGKLEAWIAAKDAYLKTKEDVRSVGAAQLQLTLLSAYETEASDVQHGSVADLKKLGDELEGEKYERMGEVRAREAAIDAHFVALAELAKTKRAVLEDDLAREVYRADIRVKAVGHKDRFQKISAWVNEKEAYLKTREVVDNTAEAQLQVSLLAQYVKENKAYYGSHVVSLKKVGDDIRAAKYESALSSWTFETPEELGEREDNLDQRFATLQGLHDDKKPVLDDHLARELHKDKLRRLNKQHAENFAKIEAWVAEKRDYLNVRESIDNTPDAQLHLGLLDNYESENKGFQDTQVASLKKLGAQINADVYKTQYSGYTWEDPAALKEREDHTDALLHELQGLHDAKRPVLNDHVAREAHKDRLRIQAKGHAEAHHGLVQWYKEKVAYLEARPEIDSVAEAQLQLSTLANYEAEKEMVTETAVAQLKADGAAINADVYKTQYSGYTWEDPASLAQREGDVDDKLAQLDALAKTLRKDLDAALARELEKERLRLKWTEQAGSFVRWTLERADEARSAIFGYTLQEVQDFEAKMAAAEAAVEKEAAQKKGAYDALWGEMGAMGIKENAYSTDTPDTLAAAKSKLDGAHGERREAYKQELATQVHHDNLCKEFADKVNSFSQWLSQEKDAVSKSEAGMADQLAKVEALAQDKQAQESKLAPIQQFEQKLEDEGIHHNRHTSLRAKDVEVQLEGFGLLLARKAEMLRELIELAKLRGVTQEEWDEFNANFGKFDKNADNAIDVKEFKALMYSVGEEMSRKEVADVFGKFGDGNGMSRESYLNYMVVLAGDSDTRDNVIEGFKLLNNYEEKCSRESLSRVMPDDDVQFIYSTMPNDDYNAWVDEVFSR